MLLRDNVISSEEVEVVEYGLENFGSSLLGMSITLLIGYCFGFLRGSFLLWLLIFPLRKNAGGYHAETKSRWFFFAIIFLLDPVENDNKRLELVEYRVYRKRARIILLLEGTLFATAVTFKWEELIAVITIVFFIVGMSLIIGKVKLWCTIYKKVER